MKKQVPVIVIWSPEKLRMLPTGDTYITVARFTNETEENSTSSWSVVLHLPKNKPADGNAWLASASFLSVDAPWSWLKSGNEFSMLEGNLVTADVKVLE